MICYTFLLLDFYCVLNIKTDQNLCREGMGLESQTLFSNFELRSITKSIKGYCARTVNKRSKN